MIPVRDSVSVFKRTTLQQNSDRRKSKNRKPFMENDLRLMLPEAFTGRTGVLWS
jgi:hypothetical protein